MSITVQISGLNKLQKLASQYPALSEKYVNAAISRSLVRVFGEEKQQAPFGVSGGLRDRWELLSGRFQGTFRSTSPYAGDVHGGTRPHYVPVKELEAWAKMRGLNPYAVAKSIARKGTKANPFLQRAVDIQKPNINAEFKNALDSIGEEIAKN